MHETTSMLRPLLTLILLGAASLAIADEVELVTGAKLQGTMKEIRTAQREFDFVLKIGQRSVKRTYAFDRVHAVTMKGKRFVLTPKSTAAASGTSVNGETPRTKAQIRRLIDGAATDPDWMEDVKLDHPTSLDLSWPLKPPTEGWKNQVNIGQYIWDIINPNPSRWQSGIKLVHHCMTLHKDQPDLLKRDMATLGRMYFELLQDYPRAAYWFEQAQVDPSDGRGVALAECYWRMGSKAMALEKLSQPRLSIQAIKLFGAMGETKRALDLTRAAAKSSQVAGQAYMLAADALRLAGDQKQAIEYYEKVLADRGFRNKDYEDRFKSRARESIEAIQLSSRAQVSKVADGAYQGTGFGYNGPIDVSVEVQAGKIESVKVTKHKEKQFYSAITDTTGQIITKQSVDGIDATSRATITSQAIINASAKALASGATP